MKASPRNRLITIERDTPTRNDLNEPVPDWSEYCREYAAVFFGTGTEQRDAAQATGTQAASFEVLSNNKTRAIRLTDRIQFDGGAWDIRSIAPIGLNAGVKINAVRIVP
ncbi:phage head completion protein [Sphingobium chungbukense]|uniref:Phage head-tail adapter protein n=1 Tax=Sphingobium chungbukense TaxID=56193 RepID=A0A0M3AZ87_9SPHN|nr:head-tail adaptor protein [Sphingobium chungbukense]KKW93874.1 hypothetical protein YP76_04245 [Sphingobium chungbukense]